MILLSNVAIWLTTSVMVRALIACTNGISKYNALRNLDKEHLVTNIGFWRSEVQVLSLFRYSYVT